MNSPRTTRRVSRLRPGVLVAGASLVLAMLWVTSPVAQAVAPANDAWTAATPVRGLPLKASVDTSEATTDGISPSGMAGRDAFSVWWRVTLPTDGPLYVSAKGSNYHLHMSLFHAANATDTPDKWTRVGSSRGGMVKQIQGGEIYYVMISTHPGRNAGIAKLTLRRPARVSLTLAKVAHFGRLDGSAVIHGTIKSTQPTVVQMSAALRQLVGSNVVTGSARKVVKAKKTSSTWSLRIDSQRAFKVGPALLSSSTIRAFDQGVRIGTFHFARHVVTLK